MLRSIVQASLRSRYLVVVLAAAFLVVGIAQLRHMPLDVLPEFELPYVEIQTEALGLSAEEVEQLITVPMEQDLLNGVPWVQSIRSESLPGLSSIVIVFKAGTDLMRGRQMVSERLTQAYALPHVSKAPTMIQPRSATSRFLIVGLSSSSLSPIQMSVLARWTIMPRLKGVPGVANVAIWGQRDRQLQVRVDPERLEDHGVSLLRILETTGNALWWSTLSFVEASTPGSGGFIDTHSQRIGVRHVFPIVSARDLAQVPVEDTNYKLADVADVVEDHQPLIGDALTRNGPGLLLVIEKFPGTNALEVTRGVETALRDLLPGLGGIEVDSKVFRPADFIEMAIRNLAIALSIGLVLLLMLLTIFFFEWRTTLIVLVAATLSVVGGGFVLYLTGSTLNAIVVTGLAIAVGIVVHNAIIDVEHIIRRIAQSPRGGDTESRAGVIYRACLESRGTVVYSTLILLLAALPIFWMGGVSGAFFRPMALSYGLALLASMVVGWTVTPALCLILLADVRSEPRASSLVGGLQRIYQAWLTRILPRPRPAAVAVALLGATALLLLPVLHRSLLPFFKERNLVIQLRCLPGTSLPEMTRISGRVRRELQAIPGVQDVSAHIGRAVFGDQQVDVDSAQIWLTMASSADYGKTASAIESVVDGYPGVNHRVETYLRGVSEDVIPTLEDRVVTRVFGETEVGLRTRAEQVRQTIAGIRGVAETRIELPKQESALEVEVDVAAAQRRGLKPGDVRRAAATLTSGIVVGNLYEEQKVFEVTVWSTPRTRHSPSAIRNLLIDTPDGGQVHLGEVAQVRMVPASSVLRHDAVKRYLDVTADVEGRDLDAVAGDIRSGIRQLQFPLEYHAEVLRQNARYLAAVRRLFVMGLAAVVGIFFLLQAASGSWRLAAVSLLALPAALVGGVLAAVVAGDLLSVGAVAGLLTVFGIAVSNKLMTIHRYQQIEREEGQPFGPGLILRGSCERLVPILMTTLAAGLIVAPALFLGDVPGLEILRPMAVVVVGGLLSFALVDLFLLPALFLRLGVHPVPELDLSREPAHGAVFGAVPAASGTRGD